MAARLDAGFETREEASDALGMKKSTYESHENGNRAQKGIPISNAIAYARRFRVDLGWLLTGRGARRTQDSVQIAGFIGAGDEVFVDEDGGRTEELGISLDEADDLEWYEVKGDSMKPRAHPGELVAFYKRDRDPRELLRQECIVVLRDGRRFFKKLAPGSAPGLYDLISYNAEDRPDETVERAGPLAMIVSRLRS